MNRFKLAYYLLRYQGIRFVWQRVGMLLRHRLGITRRTFAPRPWTEIRLTDIVKSGVPTDADAYAKFKQGQPQRFLFPLGKPPQSPDALRDLAGDRQPEFVERLDLLSNGRCIYFFRTPSPESVDWHRNPLNDKQGDAQTPFCELPDFLPEQGDQRTLWEPSRAAWAIDLGRSAAHDQSCEAGATYWQLVDSWMAENSPYQGLNWKCGQESSVRLTAILFGFWSLANDPATSTERYEQIARLAWATGYRVAHHIDYAISQKNNHAISEACGLLLIAYLFPEFRDAAKWEAKGREVMESELRRQIYDDGSYVQHSMNYQRVMLHGAILALRLSELAEKPLERDIYELVGQCGEFLRQMMDPTTGQLPNYGNNDGACVLPLSECDFLDYRPVIQATHYLVHRERILPRGPWDEDLVWLFGLEAYDAPKRESDPLASTAFESGGYYALRQAESWGMLRCHTYRDRPAQCDALHLDLWWKGQNILRDCGTYQYYVPGRADVEHYFKSIRSHNTVEIDDVNPLTAATRFMWFPWSRGECREFHAGTGPVQWLVAEQYDYDRRPQSVVHRRTVVALGDDQWAVIDDLLGQGTHRATVRWHLCDAAWEASSDHHSVILKTPAGDVGIAVASDHGAPEKFEVVRGRDERDRVQGFASSYYGERLPIPTIEATWHGLFPLRVVTTIVPGAMVAAELEDVTGGRQRCVLRTPTGVKVLDLPEASRTADLTHLRCVHGDD
jgi:hypothetical protein